MRGNRATLPAIAAVFLIFVAPLSARADFVSIAQPDAAYLAATTKIVINGNDFVATSSITDGTQTVTFNAPFDVRTVPGSWTTWGNPPNTEGNPPPPNAKVLATTFQTNPTTRTLTLSLPSSTFGFELEPELFDQFSVKADFFEGGSLIGTITRSPNGRAGSLLFAASTTTDVFDSVTIRGDSQSGGFAIAQVRYDLATAVPEPATLVLAGMGGLAWACYRRRKAAAHTRF
jgi:hypothetical protein